MSKINIVVAAQTGGAIKGLNDVTAATRRTGAAVKKAQSGMGGFTKQVSSSQVKLRKFAMGGLQQAGYQIGDYAVQVANGTSKMQAFGQQAPQLLQIFGPIGAIVGAGVAIFAAFGVAIQKSGQEVTNLSSTLGVLQAPLMAVKESVSSIKEAFGSALPAIAQNIDTALIAAGLFAAVVGVKMVRSMVMAAGAGSGLFGVMEALRLQQTLATMSNVKYTASMKLMTVATTVFKGVLSKLTMVLKTFLPIAVLAKLIEMFLQLKEGAGSFGAALGLLKDVAVEAFGRIRLAFSTVPLAIKAGSASMASFFLQRLADMAASFVDFTADVADSLNSLFNTNLTPLGVDMASQMRYVADAATETAKAASGELSGIASAVIAPLESLAVLRQSFRDGASDVTVFGAAGEKAAEGIGNAIKNKATKRIDEMKGLLNSVGQSFENAMMSAVDGTKSVKDAFKSMASEIIKELYRVFVVKRITGFITNAIGGYLNMNQVSGPSMPFGTGSVRPVARSVGNYSGGGYTGSGARAGGMDGKGGFMAMVHPRETIVDHTKGQGVGGVVVNQTINVSTGVQQTVRTEIRTLMPQIAEAAKSAVADARLRGGSYGRSFA